MYNVETKCYHYPFVLKLDEDHYTMIMFLNASGFDRHEYNIYIWGGRTRYGWWNIMGYAPFPLSRM